MPTEEAGLGEERMQLAAPDLEFVDPGKHDNGHVMAAATIRRAESPAFPKYAPGPVALDGTRIRTDGDEDDTIELLTIRGHMDAHAPAAESPAFAEDPVDLGPDR
jgi:hypothetical protein